MSTPWEDWSKRFLTHITYIKVDLKVEIKRNKDITNTFSNLFYVILIINKNSP